MPRMLLLLGSAAAFAVFSGSAATPPQDALGSAAYKQPRTPVEQRVEDLLGRITPQEKARMLAGSGWMESSPIERLCRRQGFAVVKSLPEDAPPLRIVVIPDFADELPARVRAARDH